MKDKYGDQADESESGSESESDDDSEVVSAITVFNLASYIVSSSQYKHCHGVLFMVCQCFWPYLCVLDLYICNFNAD